MYADSSLVKANVSSHQLSRSGLAVEEFREQGIEENGLFVLSESGVDEGEWRGKRPGTSRIPGALSPSVRWTPTPAGAPAGLASPQG